MPKMSIQRVRAMKKRRAADLKKRQARAKAAKEKRDKAKADKAKADKAKAKKAPAPKKKASPKKKAAAPKKKAPTKKAPTKKAAVKRREPVKAAPPKRVPIEREASVMRQAGGPRDFARRQMREQGDRLGAQQRAEAEAQRASLFRPREAEGIAEDFGGKRAPITGKEIPDEEQYQVKDSRLQEELAAAQAAQEAGRQAPPEKEGRDAPPPPTRDNRRDLDLGRGIKFRDQQIQPEQEGGGLARSGQLKSDLKGLHSNLRLGNLEGSRGAAGLQQPQVEDQRFPRAKAVIEGGREILDKPRGKEGTTLRERFRETPGAKTIGTAVDIGRGAADLFTRDEKREERQGTRAGRRIEREERRAERRADPVATTTTEGVEYEPQGEAVPREGPPDKSWETGKHGSFVEEYTPMKATLDQGTGYNQPAGPVTGGVELPMEYQGSNQYGGPTAGDSGTGPTPGGSTAGGSTGQTGGGNYAAGIVPGTNVAPDPSTGAAPQPVIDDTTNTTTGADAAAGDTQTTTGDTSGPTGASDTGDTVANGGDGDPPVGDEDPPVGEEPPVDDGTGTDRADRIKRTGERTEALAQKEGPFAGPPAQTGKVKDYDQFVRQFNESAAAKQHGLSVEYDPETGEYVQDLSGMGFEGDQRYKRLSPEEMAEALGTTTDTLREVDDPSLQTQEDEIQQLDDYDNITPPTDVTPEEMTTAQGAVKEAVARGDIKPAEYEAALARELAAINPAVGAKPEAAVVEEIRSLTQEAKAATRDEEQEEAAKAKTRDFVQDTRSMVDPVTGEKIQVSATPDAEAKTRSAILGTPADEGEAAQIIGTVGYEAAQRRAVKGTAAKSEAATMIAETADLPPDIAAAVVEDPATMEAAIDDQPVEVRAAIAALPTEALVSSQMEALLGGMEDGNTPAWARPAVAAIEQRMAERGMSVSTVGRDALFNSIIQSAMPIAQSNAQALQARAAQNLSNQQQANIEQSRQDMTRRMTNLSNRQQAGSQTAQMAQQMKTLQSQFKQEAVMTSAQQDQQVRMENLKNRQRSAELNTQNEQAMAAQNLGNEQQMAMANLQIESETEGANQAAKNQEMLAEMQVAADFLSKNAAFKQQMELANMSNDQQMRLANLTAQNQASADNLNAAQQTELANLNKNMQTNLLQAKIAQEMGVAQLSVDQQRAITNAATVANIDMAKFNAGQQVELANSKFMQSMTLTDFNARQTASMQNATSMAQLDLAAVDQRTKLAVTNANNFLAMDLANLNNEQQGIVLDAQLEQQRILSDQGAENASKQFNATSENQINEFNTSMANQMDQFNASQSNAMEQFNTSESNRMEAIAAGNKLDADKFNNEIGSRLAMFDKDQDFRRDAWNAANAQAIEQGNVEWRRKANTINTAAQNEVNRQNAAYSFAMTKDAQSAMWQELRDQATFDFQSGETQSDRIVNTLVSAMGNENFWQHMSGDEFEGFRDSLKGLAKHLFGEDVFAPPTT